MVSAPATGKKEEIFHHDFWNLPIPVHMRTAREARSSGTHCILEGGECVLGDKMNPTARVGKLFYESSTGVPALQPCSQLPRQARGTFRKLFT